MAPGLFRHSQKPPTLAATAAEAQSGPADHAPAPSGLTRRTFLVGSSFAAGAAAVISSIPGVANILTTAEADSPEIDGSAGSVAGAGGALGPALSQPIVAHVLDVGTGEINFYQGTAQVVARNPGLAQAIARLAAPRS